ncbi:fatty acyl-CoA reductase 1-like [Dendronephthya gigantea]|uniref:fatty acyl-CoA reductase 1-like n=1 Tax=Dendronephthya gigantea TaxID=151771 RepID=UPI00106998E4|nr:fatty acyl-CoA reductase 1-like [Dendronephthya gigantea]XP_028403979.1 fatty acyl-CoA reductase 1-like [Dendronephthya gigantea]
MEMSAYQSIVDYYAGKSLFITGGTGFLGKVLVEKLLRSCPDIKKIYLLVRPKGDVSSKERVEKILDSELFSRVPEVNPGYKEVVHVVDGDMSKPFLGLSKYDQNLLHETVEIVFHSAATVRFDEELRLALTLNVVGLENVLELCRNVKKLEAFIHVSTAYSNCNEDVIEEKFYPPSVDVKNVLEIANWMNDQMLNEVTPALLEKRPNTYTFTKSLAESLLFKHGHGLPIAVFRPSIVGASLKEPMPGWVDNFNGPSGLFVAVGKGVLRSMIGDVNAVADVIPVDVAVNMLACVGWYAGTKRPQSIPIFHCTTGSTNPVTWGEMKSIVTPYLWEYPFEKAFRRPNFSFEAKELVFTYWTYISHRIPAWIADILAKFVGQKPRMQKNYVKLEKAMSTLEYFTKRGWTFKPQNYNMLLSELQGRDIQEFSFDVRRIEWHIYFRDFVIGIKKYLLKENPSDLSAAKKRFKRLRNVRWTTYFVSGVLMWTVMVKKIPSIRSLWYLCLDYAFKMFTRLEKLGFRL